MTFVIAQITDSSTGSLSLLADTKITVRGDVTETRKIYTRPCLKVVVLSDDLAVGFAGDSPELALPEVVRLRGAKPEDVVESLREYTERLRTIRRVSKSFVIAERAVEPRLWTVSNGEIEDRTSIGTAWVGDRDAFRVFQSYRATYLRLTKDRKAALVSAMASVIAFEKVESVGGYMVRASGSSSTPFRFFGDPAGSMPWLTHGSLHISQGRSTMRLAVPPSGDTTEHWRIGIPGREPTFSALAHYIPEINMALLHTHDQPWLKAIKLTVSSVSDLVETALRAHGQHLQLPPASAPGVRSLLGM